MARVDRRRRGCSPPTAAASSAYFPPDLIPEVANRLTNLEDFFSLRASCRAYRALLPLTPSNLASQSPLLVVYHPATDSYALFHILRRRLLRYRFPHPRLIDRQHGHRVHSLGCLVAIDFFNFDDCMTALRILHPFTGEETCLPDAPQEFHQVIICGDVVLALPYCGTNIQYRRLQDASWRVASISGPYFLEYLIHVNGTIYTLVATCYSISPSYRLAVVGELAENDDPVELVFLGGELDAQILQMHETSERCLFLAECSGDTPYRCGTRC